MIQPESNKIVNMDGAIEWRKNTGSGNKYTQLLHRTDGPAIIRPDGKLYWFQEGKMHREDGPSITYPDGTEFWFKNGKLHRTDGPALIRSNGEREWYLDGIKYNPISFILKLFEIAE